MSRSASALAALLAVLVAAVYFSTFDMGGRDYWATYIIAPATVIAGEPATLWTNTAAPSCLLAPIAGFQTILSMRTATASSRRDQRIGPGVTLAPPYLAFGMAGFRLWHAALGALTFLFALALGKRIFAFSSTPFFFGVLVALNPFLLAMDRPNANLMAVPIVLALFVLLTDDEPKWLIAGLVYGALGGIKNEAIVLGPAVLAIVLTRSSGRPRALAFVVGGALAGIAPYLVWNKIAFGQVLIHASQYAGFHGFRPEFPHRLGPWSFTLNGLFQLAVSRPSRADAALPVSDLSYASAFAPPLFRRGSDGAGSPRVRGLISPKKARIHLPNPVAFLLDGALSLSRKLGGAQEHLRRARRAAAGRFLRGGRRVACHRPSLPETLGGGGGVRCPHRGAVTAARFVHVPVDERWYVRFPKSKIEAKTVGCLRDLDRREWMFFHTDECASELLEQREKLTRPGLLPRFYYPLYLGVPDFAAEWRKQQPVLFDVWEKIYGE
ncbi:MAG: hypothetical protein M5R36_00260 [Deltaproteobacteria bacterium]|nr:hypothetical protein [Deltaproteobacteria bacterium]